jgi:hypothetical protein
MYVNVTKKDLVGRKANLYETRNEVIQQIIESLKQGRRCLAISDRKTSVKICQPRLSPLCKTSYFFTSDEDEEESLQNFRKDPKQFIQETKPELLFCSPLLRSGVSFVEQFDDVFVMVDSENFTARDIIQMLSRERKWKNAHIYTNHMKIEIPKVGDINNNRLLALSLLLKDKREQLLVRPISTAYRLDSRGCSVTFFSSNSVNFKKIEIDEPEYVKSGADGRRTFEDYVLSIITNSNKASSLRNIVQQRQSFEGFGGAKEAINKLLADRNYIAFYDFCRRNSPALKTPAWFSRFGGCMKQWGIDDNGFFKELADDKVTRSELTKNKSLMKRILDLAPTPSQDGYKLAGESLKILRGLMPLIDKYETNNREEIEMLLQTYYGR